MSPCSQKKTLAAQENPSSGYARARNLLQEPMVLAVGSFYRSGVFSNSSASMSHEDRKLGMAENVISNAPGQ
jgi:hypothetical protein